MESKTQTGLYYIIIGSIITLIITLISSITYLLTQDLAAMAIISILALVSFIGLILILVGAIYFLIGRKEFGEKHDKNVITAVIIFVISIVLSAILIAGIVFSAISSISSTSGFDSTPASSFLAILTVVSAILGGLMYYYALIELEDEQGKKFLFAGIIASICISVFTSIYSMGTFGEIFESASSTSSYSSINVSSNLGGIQILSLIPYALLIIAIYIPYKRIKEGELKPQFLSSQSSTDSGRICPNCGRPIPFDSKICPYCAKKFE